MKRPFAVLGGLLAFACLLLSVGAVWWVWAVKKPVIEKTTYAFGRVEEALGLAQRSVDQAKENLGDARAKMSDVGHLTSAGRGRRNLSYPETIALKALTRQLTPNISEVQQSLDRVTEASIVINSLLETVENVQDLQLVDPDQVRALRSHMGTVTRASWELGGALDAGTQTPESEEERSARIAANLDLVISMVDEFQKGVAGLQARVRHYKDSTLYWMELGPKLVTVALVWVAISQVIVIAVVVRAVRRGP